MQTLYRVVFNTIFKLTKSISERTRDMLLFFCCAAVVWVYFFSHLSLGGGDIEVICSVIAAFMVLFSIDREMKPIEWNKFVYYPMVLFGIGILAIGQMHFVGDGFVMFALDLIFLFPGLYYVWICRGDHEKLYRMLSMAVIVGALISFAYCVILAARGALILDGIRVCGHKTHPNNLGMMGVIILASSIYLINEFPRKKWVTLLSAAGIGIGITYMIVSVSRTSILAAVVCVLVSLVFDIKRRKNAGAKASRGASAIVASIVIFGMVFALGMNLDDINRKVLDSKTETPEISENVEQSAPEAPSEMSEADAVADRMSMSDKTVDSFSSGRIGIWKIYLSNLSLWGNSKYDILGELELGPETRAHNNFLEYYFRCGYIVGTIYLFFYVAMGIIGLKMLFSRKKSEPKHLFVVMMIGMYSVFAMIEVAMLPFIRIVPCFYFLTIAPIFEKETDR